MRIVAGNRLETLADALAAALRSAPLPPLDAETVIVQSPGMRRWLTLELARRLGCSAGLATPFPSRFCLDLAARLSGQDPSHGDGFAREALSWRLFAWLGQPLTSAVFAPLAAYLRDDDPLRRWQLALRLADRFDEYQLYRGQELLAWEVAPPAPVGDGHVAWQAELWRELVADADAAHPARQLHDAIRILETSSRPAGLPPRLTAFVIGGVPPSFLDLLRALARHLPVTLYLVSPTPHYWGDLRSPREQARELRRTGSTQVTAEVGNPLLAGFGRQSRELFVLLQQRDDSGQAWEDLEHADPGTGCALHVLQHDVLELIDRGHDGTAPLPLAANDDSLTVHSCHSPLRELEVVRDQLYAAFAADPTLVPDQVLVLVTDLDRYAPFAATVLGARREGMALPVRLADRGRDAEQPVARALLAVLRLIDTRLTAPEVCDLLELDPLRDAAGITREELATVRSWIAATGIRWGADAADRVAHGLPAFAGNSWREGLARLVGGAATGSVDQLVAGVAPWAGDTMGTADLIGRFVIWFDRLISALADLRQPRPMSDWAIAMPALVDGLLGDDETAIALRTHLADLLGDATRHAGNEPLDLAVVRDHLSTSLANDAQAGAFLWGGITIAALKPLRTIPARVIAVCGLDDGLFPRRSTPSAFDLIASRPQAGDRRVRDEDRQLLLDTLLAARDRIILTYVGRSQVDDNRLPPSVCVAELLDWCDNAFTTTTGTPRERLIIDHPLQPFSSRYVDGVDPRLFTYAPVAGSSRAALPAFVNEPLPTPAGDLAIDWHDLAEAWINPSRHFCRQTLDLRFASGGAALDEHEPFTLDGLGRFQLHGWITERLRAGATAEQLGAIAVAQGVLPIGGLGTAAFASACAESVRLIARLGDLITAPPLALAVNGPGWRLGGVLDQRTSGGVVLWRPGRLREQDLITAWIAHLATQVADGLKPTRMIGIDRAVTFQPVTEAAEILADMVDGFREGLSRPLPLSLRAGHGYVDQVRKPAAKADPLTKARQGWDDDRNDPYVARCWSHCEPLFAHDEAFFALALRVWEPLFDAMQDDP